MHLAMARFLWKPAPTGRLTTLFRGPVTKFCTFISRCIRETPFCVLEKVTTQIEPRGPPPPKPLIIRLPRLLSALP